MRRQKKYRFVDFAAHHQKGFRNHIVDIQEVPQLIKQFSAFECFSTYFFYTDEIFAYLSTHSSEGHPSISGYHGKTWSPFLPIDIDSPDLSKALETTRLIVQHLVQSWGVEPRACPVYFSGSKGFHMLLDTRLFGKISPTQHLHQIFSALREDIIYQLPPFDHSVIDMTLKDPVRLLRLPNTLHAKSHLYKIPLDYEKIFSVSMSSILEEARTPQPLLFTDETGLISNVRVSENPQLTQIFKRVRRHVRRYTRKPFIYRLTPKHGEDPKDFLCPGYLKIWESHVGVGLRNNCAIRLLSEFRLNGLTQDKARELIYHWNHSRAIGLSEQELEHTVHSAYAHPFPYRYRCHDPIAQEFCPHHDLSKCEAWVQEKFGSRNKMR